MKTLAIIGSGDLGQQIAHYSINDNHFEKIVFIDDFAEVGSFKNGYEIIGNTSQVIELFANKKFNQIIIGIGYKHLHKRKEIFETFSNTIPFATIIHSSTWVDKTAIIQAGCVIYPCCNIDAHSMINENTILNIGCTIAHDTNIGKHCFLSPRVAMAGFIKVEEQCIIGINATIIDNLTITTNTQIGGGTVVTKNITQSGLYVGNPHKFIR